MGKHKRKHDGPSDESGAGYDEDRQKNSKKHKKEKKDKKTKKEDEEKQLLKAARKFLKQKLKGDGGEASEKPDDTPLAKDAQIDALTEDDYFRKNAEFSEWLRLERGRFFNELSSEQTHELFAEFAAAWNARSLPARYYLGVADTSLRRTKHAWGIRGGAEGASRGELGMAAAMEDDRNAFGARREVEAADRKAWRADQKEALDELLPKATGREALIEKKAARREAARERDASPDLVKLPGGGDVMGGDDSLAAAKAREAKRGDWRAKQQVAQREEMHHKVAAAQAAEDAKMAAFRALAAKGPISIAKRT